MNAYINQYQNNQILNASPEQILILLYDGSIRFCRQAIHAMDAGDRTTQAEKISRAMAIVCEFSNTLDHEIGGDMAADLDALYGLWFVNSPGQMSRMTVVHWRPLKIF